MIWWCEDVLLWKKQQSDINFFYKANKSEWWSNIIDERNARIFGNLLLII